MVHTKLQVRMNGILPPHLKADNTVYQRFLKARDYDLEKAEIMLKKHIIWRKAHQIDTFLDNFQPKEFFRNYIEPSTLGFGKEGEILIYVPVGRIEIEDILKCTTINDYMNSWIWYIEKQLRILKEQSERTGKSYNQMSFIFDLDKLTFRNASNKSNIDLYLRLIDLFQDNYPERLKAVYLINAPAHYVLVYNIVKKIMSAAMVKKIHVLGQNDFQDKLLEVIDADILPAFLGGKKTDPDGNPLCQSFVSRGGSIPEIYRLAKEDRYFKENSEVKKLVIPKCGKEEIVVDVADKAALLHWEFCVKGKGISFGLYQQVSDEDVAEILPMEIYHTPDGKEWGSYRCHRAGRYIFTFENSQSWLSSRIVEYCINVQNSTLES